MLPPPPSDELVHEMMSFLACGPVADDVVPMFLEDLHLDGADAGAITWGDEIPDDGARRRARRRDRVRRVGPARRASASRRPDLPFTIVEKNGGPGGTWWENRYPGARVDIGSHFYCYSFEPADHWTEYFSQHPELRAYFERVMDEYGSSSTAGSTRRSSRRRSTTSTGRWAVTVTNPDGTTDVLDARAVISAVGALNIAEAARHPGDGRLRRAVVPLGALGPFGRLPRASGSR